MKTLYFDCRMGAAGDMLTAALLELHQKPDEFVEKLNSLGIPGVHYEKSACEKCGIMGTHMTVTVHGVEESEEMFDHDHEHHDHEHHDHEHHDHEHHDHEHHHHEHHHTKLSDVHDIVDKLPVSEKVKKDVLGVYGLIAEAESYAHEKPVNEVHFHEVGNMDAIADVTAVCMLMEELAPEQVIVSPIHVGSGTVKCAHGILNVPAPATAYILKNIPTYGGAIKSELCTPTGAALLRYFADAFGEMPNLSNQTIGYGMGKKDFKSANCVSVFMGETPDRKEPYTLKGYVPYNAKESRGKTEYETVKGSVVELSCNIDDMSAEDIAFAMDVLLDAGALDVYTISIGMKKSRQGVMLNTLCKDEDKQYMVELLFKHTTTIGIREQSFERYTLDRHVEMVKSPLGDVRKKVSAGFGVERKKYEFEDLADIARRKGMSLAEVRKELNKF